MAGIFPAVAWPSSIAERVRSQSLPSAVVQSGIYESSPATMLYRDSVSLSKFGVGLDYRHYDEAYMVQLGRGHTLLSVSARSYKRLSPLSAVWGSAGFATGTYRDIRWTDCVDYLKLAPYVLGDAVGGDMSSRRYDLGGGWVKSFGRWVFGIQGSYTARVDYRNRDPRVKNVVSDLNIRLGLAYAVAGNYVVGICAGFGVYNQNCDVDFYNPMNDIDTYTLTGMGTYYARFMGNTNKNSGYDSFGCNVGLQLVSTDREGLGISVNYYYRKVEQLLRNYNNLTLGYSVTYTLSGTMAYKVRLSEKCTALPCVNASHERRDGTENLFGSTSAGSYPLIGHRSMYHHAVTFCSLNLPVQFNSGSGIYFARIKAGSRRDHEWYVSPKRSVDVGWLESGLELGYSQVWKNWLIDIRGGFSRSFITLDEAVFTDMDVSSELSRCVMHNYDMLASEYNSGTVSLGVSKAVDVMLLGVELKYGITSFRSHGYGQSVSVGINANF